ncbi:lactate dehydrogenase-like 2-hydroxyacid dehydrogenase [Palleronia aestuarii]|uniref:Lactate dehydrogenase-like 2-hydroxyacid dehydrogenase n=1 Tax=Palleronia aestuarii TaxID=568105 RepID=A0A2W7NVI1_9RHOB|nr:2-hydroxyacid dehydrogenase [Palleronia aestuarii]PZX15232.1 lactate dehydrogenase-like 2-hydroxyacid dehydrogenase [Palleronia aestuarii]
MSKPDLLLVAGLTPRVVEQLEKDFTLHRYCDAEDKSAFLKDVPAGIRFVATGGSAGCTREIIEALPDLEIISSFGVGYDAVDVDAAKEHDVRVTNTPDVLNDCVAEVAMALMLALAHRLPEADRYLRDGRWESEGSFPLTAELTGRKLGIIGLGRIGKTIARLAQAFQMQVVYHGRSEQPHQPYTYYSDPKTMARDVDWLLVIAPSTPETQGIVNRDVLEALGPEGRLVNVARGDLVDEEVLIEMLSSGGIAGAALDVFAQEPHVPEALRKLDNVVLLPHVGSATHKTRAAMGDLVVRNLRAHLKGDPLPTPVA